LTDPTVPGLLEAQWRRKQALEEQHQHVSDLVPVDKKTSVQWIDTTCKHLSKLPFTLRKTRKVLRDKWNNRREVRHTTMLVMGRTMQQKEQREGASTDLEEEFKQPRE
jgi:hypothetical protein